MVGHLLALGIECPAVKGLVSRKAPDDFARPPDDQGSGDRPRYFAAVIELTLMVLVLASRVPVTVTFLPASFSGEVWSLNM